MKCQILFPGENKKIISKCHLLKHLPRVLSVNKPETPSLCPFSIQITVAGGGITWHTDREPSIEEQATLVLSSLANFTLVTEKYIYVQQRIK